MPIFELRTNIESSKVTDELIQELTTTLAKLLGKPPAYVAITIQADQKVSFGGSTQPAGLAVLRSIGGVGGKKNNEHSKVLYPILNKFLGIPTDRLYIEFVDISPSDIAYNGKTFA